MPEKALVICHFNDVYNVQGRGNSGGAARFATLVGGKCWYDIFVASVLTVWLILYRYVERSLRKH